MDELTKTIQAVEEASRPDDLIRLSTGVMLRGKKPNTLTLITVLSSFPRPKPPVVFIKNMGREMENVDDPDYIERVKAWRAESNTAVLNALILMGTELHSTPEGFPGPDDQSWMDDYSVLGLPMNPTNKAWRYLAWIKHRACRDEEDLQKIQKEVGRLSGVREADVKTASTFPGSNDARGRD